MQAPLTGVSQEGKKTTICSSPTPLTKGYLKLYIGPMFSQKTRSLLSDLEMLARSNCRALYVNHASDQRDDVASRAGVVTTHQKGFSHLPEGVAAISVSSLGEIPEQDLAFFDCLGVDECQFYPDLKEKVEKWITRDNKHVICAGLDSDAFMRPFGQTLDLIPLCDKVKKMRAKCTICRSELEAIGYGGDPLSISAPFTLRLAPGRQQTLVGGSNSYTAVCRSHHLALSGRNQEESSG